MANHAFFSEYKTLLVEILKSSITDVTHNQIFHFGPYQIAIVCVSITTFLDGCPSKNRD